MVREVTRNLDNWEVKEYEVLFLTRSRVRLDGTRDHPTWRLNARGIFSIRSFYNYLAKRRVMSNDFPFKQTCKVNASLE